MFRYEILILTIPEITKDEASTLEFQVDKLINAFKGSIISFERWGKYRLAYPVRKNDYGVYFLVRFEAEDKQALAKDLNTLFAVKFSDIVMRNMVSALEEGQSLEYIKPPSLEDTPKRHISSFLEEKGLLKGNRANSAEKSTVDSVEETSTPEESLKESGSEPSEVSAKPEAKADALQEKTVAEVEESSDKPAQEV